MIARTTVAPFLFGWFYCQRIPKQPAFSLVTITFSPHVASHGIVNLRVIHLMSVSFHWSVQPLLVLKKRLHLRSKDWSSIKFIFHILLVILTNAELKKNDQLDQSSVTRISVFISLWKKIFSSLCLRLLNYTPNVLKKSDLRRTIWKEGCHTQWWYGYLDPYPEFVDGAIVI